MAESRTAVVSGGTGFLGRRLCERLVQDGWAVIVLTRTEASLGRMVNGAVALPIPPGIHDLVTQVSARHPDVIYHLASQGGASHDAGDIAGILEANVTIGCALLEACRATHSRFVGLGTFWQHSRPSSGVHPNSLYAASKQALEDLAVYYRYVEDVRAVILKPHEIYGPGDSRGKLLQQLATASIKKTELLTTEGEQLVSFIHVTDVVNALIFAAERLVHAGLDISYGISGPETSDLRGTIERLVTDLGLEARVRWGARPYRPNEVMRAFRTHPLPGWEPTIVLSVGFRELLEYARQHE